jgi:putative spermidine/putrescine transport system permease protein
MTGLSTIPLRRTITVLTVAILAVPTIFIVVASFGGSREIAFPPHSFTTHWYSNVIGNSRTWTTLFHSLVAALVASFVAAVAGVPAAIGLSRVGARMRVVLAVVLSAGLSAPPIIAAFGFYDVFSRLNLAGLLLLGVALGIVNFPFMLWAVTSALEDEDPELMPAAATLGADPVEQFLFVRLPLITPGVMTGTLLVFVLSLTDFVVSQVLTNVGDQTLAVYVYSSLRATISPALGASSAVFIAIAAAAFALVLRFGQMERFLFRRG